MPNEHHCHAKGCTKVVPPRMLMCYPHWKMVPLQIQRWVWREYREGQEIDKQPSHAYMQAMHAAIDAVDAKEHPATGV
jgi:hypothetical protein